MLHAETQAIFTPKDWSPFNVYLYALDNTGFPVCIIDRRADCDTDTQAAWEVRWQYHVGIDTAIGPDSTVTWEPFDA